MNSGIQAAQINAIFLENTAHNTRREKLLTADHVETLVADHDSLEGLLAGAVVGPDIYIIRGGLSTLRLTNCLPRRIACSTFAATVTSLPASFGGSSHTITGDGGLTIEADRVGPSGRLWLRARDTDSGCRVEMPLRFWVSPATGYVTSPRILLIGDSLTNRRIAVLLDAKLRAMGMAPTFLGTMAGQGLDDIDNGPLGEGREGWEFADYTHQNMRHPGFGLGQEATYAALSKAAKLDLNPFIRRATGTDPEARIFNGTIFDFGFYLARFGFAVPDYVLVTLGQNDENVSAPPAIATRQVVDGLNTIIPSIRAAGSDIRIAVGLHTRPRGTNPDAEFAAYRYPSLRAIAAHVQASGDANLSVLPFWQHMSEEAPWTMSTLAPANAVGLSRTAVADPIHFGEEQRHAVAELIRNWIAKGESGGAAYTS